jgi:CBS-domain-containing membrane protein
MVKKHALRVRDVMSANVRTIGPETPFAVIVETLLEHDISGLPVVDEAGALLGIVTEADLITKEAYGESRRRHLSLVRDHLTGREPAWIGKSTARVARELMTEVVETASPDDDLAVVARRMLEGHLKRLPVCQNGRLVGIVARHDLLRPFSRSDHELADDIEAILLDPLRAPEAHDVTFAVRKGIVTLRGTTRWPRDAQLLARFVAAVPGVVAVDDATRARERDPHV